MQANSLSAISLVAVLTAVVVYVLSRFASNFGLLALPGGHRLHQEPTPMVGGIAIYVGLLAGLPLINGNYASLLPSLFLMCCVGALDDRYKLPSWLRFLMQAIAAYLMIYFTQVILVDLGFLFSPERRVVMGSTTSVVMTIFSCIGVINAINMSDGMDGLSASLVLTVLVAFLIIGHPASGLIMVSLGALLGFLFWNIRIGRQRATAFMGDAGSTMLGILVAYILILPSQLEGGILPVTALWFLALPLLDAVAVLIVRPLRGRSPFSADRIHYHHQLLDRGISVNLTLFIIIALQSLLVLIGLALWHYNVAEHIQLRMFLILFLVYVVRLYSFSGKLLEHK